MGDQAGLILGKGLVFTKGPPLSLPPQTGGASAEEPSGRGAPEAVPHAEGPPGLSEDTQGRRRHPGLRSGHVRAENLPPGA